MKKIVAVIEKGDGEGYSVYAADDSVPVVGSGQTEAEARADFEAVMAEQADYMKEQTGSYPEWKDAQVEYRYDLTAFLMRKYKNGLAAAGEKQKNLIQSKLTEIVQKMERVKFA